jgi:hypothetical protein
VALVEGNAAQRLSEHLMTFGTSEPTNLKDQVDHTSKAHHVSNQTILILVNVVTHTPATGTDSMLKVNATMESGFLFGFINLV